MNHLEWHQHAFLDENDVVILVPVFDEWAHNHQLLDNIKNVHNASKIICCCQYGLGSIGQQWDEETKSWIPLPVFSPFEIPSDFEG